MIKKVFLKLLCVLAVLSTVFLMSGCSLYIASLDKLLRAPMSDPELQKTINKCLGSSVTLLAPGIKDENDDSGYFSSTLNYADLDSDGRDEVICFYSEKSSPENVRVLILKSDGEKWEIISDTDGSGSEISSLRVMELSDSSFKQIVTTWKYFDNTILNISGLEKNVDGSFTLARLCEDMQFNEIEMVDVDSDSFTELLVVNYDLSSLSDSGVSFLTLLDIGPSGKVVALGNADLTEDYTRMNYSFSKGSSETPFTVFFDYKDEKDLYHTCIYFWDAVSLQMKCVSDGTIVYKINSAGEKYNSVFNSARLCPSKCVDVNNDGVYETPVAQNLDDSHKTEGSLAYTRWSKITFSKDGTCAFSEVGSEKRIYFDEMNFLKIPAYFDDDKLYAFLSEDREWSFVYGDFGSAEEAKKSENSRFAVVKAIDDGKIEEYESDGYAVLGSFGEESGVSLMYSITSYGSAMGLNKDEIFNIK